MQNIPLTYMSLNEFRIRDAKMNFWLLNGDDRQNENCQ